MGSLRTLSYLSPEVSSQSFSRLNSWWEIPSLCHRCQRLTALLLAWPPLGAGVCRYVKGLPSPFPYSSPLPGPLHFQSWLVRDWTRDPILPGFPHNCILSIAKTTPQHSEQLPSGACTASHLTPFSFRTWVLSAPISSISKASQERILMRSLYILV